MNFPRLAAGDGADVCLLLEGTYPYVKGGVSSWVHQLISGLPDIRFAAVFLGSVPGEYGDLCYPLPANLVHLETHYLFAHQTRPPVSRRHLGRTALEPIETLHGNLDGLMLDTAPYLAPDGPLGESAFLYGEESWAYITAMYEARCTDPSFVDYFWTVRSLHQPLWLLARVAEALPPCRLLHSLSTGYGGLLGAFAAQRTGVPYLLMEHGIYTKERRIDLMSAAWISDNRNIFQRDPTELSYFRELWMRFFETLGRLAYRKANSIVSLYQEANRLQIRDGADPARTRIIPNGVNVERLASLRRPEGTSPPPVLCLLGRVVMIKDIKTFIRAVRIVLDRVPEAEAWIVGPEDEDPDYVTECRDLANSLHLGKHLRFRGFQRLEDILPEVGLLVLSSISEGLPLVLIEGFAAGIPAITTPVGACPQLIEGLPGPDAELGRAGRIVDMAEPDSLAAACLELLVDDTAYGAARTAAIARVERYYNHKRMFSSLRTLYAEHLD